MNGNKYGHIIDHKGKFGPSQAEPLRDLSDVGFRTSGVQLGDWDGFDNATTIKREQLHVDYYDKPENREPEFRLCARSKFYDFSKMTPFDARGKCCMCEIEVIYDRKATKDSLPKVCLPCAVRLYKDGFKALTALGSYEPTMGDINDETMMARLASNIVENKQYNAVHPKYVLPKEEDLPQHKLRQRQQGETNVKRSD